MKVGGRKHSPRGPFAKIRHGSAVVPIYRGMVRDHERFTVIFYLHKRQVRRTFGELEKAKQEARIAAMKIHEGLGHTNDLPPQQRDDHLAALKMLEPFDTPLRAAIDEYTKCRQRLGEYPLLVAVDEFLRRARDVRLGATVPEVIEEFLKAKKQDQVSQCHLSKLDYTTRRFVKAFPGEILRITSDEIDRWLRSHQVSPVTRNSLLRNLKIFFSFAKTRSYLPKSEPSAAEAVPFAKTGELKTEIFQPAELDKILLAAPQNILGLLAVGGFAGLRAAEMERLNWSAVDLQRRIITLRSDQAKTASRRIVPISDNLARWLEFTPREGKIAAKREDFREANELARKLGIDWPHNGLRHSYISYRVALTNDVNKVALEAGNSSAIIFKHYRELVTEDAAKQWFAIVPPAGWTPPPRVKKPIGRPRKHL